MMSTAFTARFAVCCFVKKFGYRHGVLSLLHFKDEIGDMWRADLFLLNSQAGPETGREIGRY